jgi:hypothetical protein
VIFGGGDFFSDKLINVFERPSVDMLPEDFGNLRIEELFELMISSAEA